MPASKWLHSPTSWIGAYFSVQSVRAKTSFRVSRCCWHDSCPETTRKLLPTNFLHSNFPPVQASSAALRRSTATSATVSFPTSSAALRRFPRLSFSSRAVRNNVCDVVDDAGGMMVRLEECAGAEAAAVAEDEAIAPPPSFLRARSAPGATSAVVVHEAGYFIPHAASVSPFPLQ